MTMTRHDILARIIEDNTEPIIDRPVPLDIDIIDDGIAVMVTRYIRRTTLDQDGTMASLSVRELHALMAYVVKSVFTGVPMMVRKYPHWPRSVLTPMKQYLLERLGIMGAADDFFYNMVWHELTLNADIRDIILGCVHRACGNFAQRNPLPPHLAVCLGLRAVQAYALREAYGSTPIIDSLPEVLETLPQLHHGQIVKVRLRDGEESIEVLRRVYTVVGNAREHYDCPVAALHQARIAGEPFTQLIPVSEDDDLFGSFHSEARVRDCTPIEVNDRDQVRLDDGFAYRVMTDDPNRSGHYHIYLRMVEAKMSMG